MVVNGSIWWMFHLHLCVCFRMSQGIYLFWNTCIYLCFFNESAEHNQTAVLCFQVGLKACKQAIGVLLKSTCLHGRVHVYTELS